MRHLAMTSPVWSPFENTRIELSGSEMICTETVTVFRGDLGFPVFGLWLIGLYLRKFPLRTTRGIKGFLLFGCGGYWLIMFKTLRLQVERE